MRQEPHDELKPPELEHLEPEDDLDKRLAEAMESPGYLIEVDPDEADALGACPETALGETEAWEATMDLNWEVDHD